MIREKLPVEEKMGWIMKKRIGIIIAVLICMVACGKEKTNNGADQDNGVYSLQEEAGNAGTTVQEEDTVLNEENRKLIADALGIEENSRNIRFMLSCLDTINAGKLQSAELSEDNGERLLNVVAEDGTRYQIYLTDRGSVEAVKNLDTGEWPVQSAR